MTAARTMPKTSSITRPRSLTEQTAGRLRAMLESGEAKLSEILRSERELAHTYRVSRDTIRKALGKLVNDGYLASLPRQGYQVVAPHGAARASTSIAFVHGSPRQPWEFSPFNLNLLNAFQRGALDSDRELLTVGLGRRTPEELARDLLAKKVAGVIVDSDDPGVALAMRDAGLATVLVDHAHPELDSVLQDNFSAAREATRRLIERGHRRIAFAGRYIEMIHGQERLGGFLAALAQAGLPAPAQWRLTSRAELQPGQALVELARAPDGPTAVALLWPELLEDAGTALTEAGLALDLVVWWGATPEKRAWWKERFPRLPVPDGMQWEVVEMARLALARLDERFRGYAGPPTCSRVGVRLVPGEAPCV